MTTNMQSNISGAAGVILAVINHFAGNHIPDWVGNDILVPIIIAAFGHCAWLIGKK